MENPSSGTKARVESAVKMNASLARRVGRWKRSRLLVAALLAVIGIGVALTKTFSIWSVPCLIGAFIAYLLYLDARDQLREVKSRHWVSATPKIGELKNDQPNRAADAPAVQ